MTLRTISLAVVVFVVFIGALLLLQNGVKTGTTLVNEEGEERPAESRMILNPMHDSDAENPSTNERYVQEHKLNTELQVYHNSALGFEIAYPPNFVIAKDLETDGMLVFIEDVHYGTERTGPFIILTREHLGKMSANEYLAEALPGSRVNGYSGVESALEKELLSEEPLAIKGVYGPSGSVFRIHDVFAYELAWNYNPRYEAVVDEMYPTLRFFET